MSSKGTPLNRGEFFRDLGRYTLLGILAGGGALLARRHRLNRNGQKCINKSICCGCSAYKDCGLPAAATAKQHQAQN